MDEIVKFSYSIFKRFYTYVEKKKNYKYLVPYFQWLLLFFVLMYHKTMLQKIAALQIKKNYF